MTNTIYTAGHGALDFGAFTSLIAAHQVDTIIDVRSEPYSRRAPDFSKRRLEQLAAAGGLGYRWLGGSLGGRPEGLRDGADELDWDAIVESESFTASLGIVERLAEGGRIVLLCGEPDPYRCHRSGILGSELTLRGNRVEHILADGTATPHHTRFDL